MNRRRFLTVALITLFFVSGTMGQESGSETITVNRPWNGYWWPVVRGGLATGLGYENQPSPYMKYSHIFDPYRLALDWEMKVHYNPDGEDWAGHCNGWAAASISEAQPPMRSVIEDSEFFYGDMTGFYTECYQSSTAILYGTRYSNESDDFTDIDPLVFQQTLELYLKVNGIPIVADLDPDVEVWSYPIYRYTKTWNIEGSVKHVTVQVFCATDLLSHPDEPGVNDYVKAYGYDIQLNGAMEEVSAEWVGVSVQDHPDFLWYPEISWSANPHVSLEAAREIAGAPLNAGADDQYEENDTDDLAAPFGIEAYGRLLDDDWFSFELDPGEFGEVVVSTRELGLEDEWMPLLFSGNGQEQGPFVQADDGTWRVAVDAATSLNWKVKVPQRIGYTGNYMVQLKLNSISAMIPLYSVEGDTSSTVVCWNHGTAEARAGYTTWLASGSTHSYGSGFISPCGVATFQFDGSNPFDPIPEWLRLVVSDAAVTGYVRLDNAAQQTLGLYRPVSGSRDILVPHVPARRHFWELEIALMNTNRAESVTMQLNGYNHEGMVQATAYRELAEGSKWTGKLDDLFTGVDTTAISHVIGRATGPVSTVVMYRAKNDHEMAIIPAVGSNLGSDFTLPLNVQEETETTWAGLVLLNPVDALARVELYWYDSSDWRPLAQTTVYVENFGNLVSTLDGLVPDGAGDVSSANRIEVKTNNLDMQGFLLVGDHGATRLSPVELLPDGQNLDSRIIAVPVLAANEQQRVVLQNFELTPRNALFRTLNAAGEQVGSTVVSLSGGERKTLNRADWPVSDGYSIADVRSVEVQKDDNVFWWVRFAGEDGKSMEIVVR